jgi:50S ribosomal subunit-associated GTPase HflX
MCSSHPLAQQQIDAVERVLKELDVESIPKLVVWNKVCLLKYLTCLVKFSTFSLYFIFLESRDEIF